MKDLLKPQSESLSIGKETLIQEWGQFKLFEADYKTKSFNSFRVVKYDHSGIIGVLQFFRESKRSKKVTISNICVREDRRRQGIATDLFNFIKRQFTVQHSKDLTSDGEAWKKTLN